MPFTKNPMKLRLTWISESKRVEQIEKDVEVILRMRSCYDKIEKITVNKTLNILEIFLLQKNIGTKNNITRYLRGKI